MRLKWQWFLGGKIMFWVSIILFIILLIAFTVTYVIDSTTIIHAEVLKIDPTSVQNISEKYISDLNIQINKKIVYRFVKFKKLNSDQDTVLLGAFHEWNGVYYIDISVDLYNIPQSLTKTVIHETRHMIIEYLKFKNIIDLTKYTEQIAQNNNSYYNNLFNSGIYLLKEEDK